MLVGNFPNPSQTASAGCRLRVLSERFHPHTNKKARQRPTQNRPLACFVYRLCCLTGSAAGPAAVYHLRRIARYFSVPAKTAASCRGPCSISHSTVTTSHSRRKKDCAILYLQAPSSKRCTVSTPKTPERCTPSHSPSIRNCGILFTSSCQGCLRDNLRLSTRHSRNPQKHGILIIASPFNRPGGTERHGNRYYETLPSRQIPW